MLPSQPTLPQEGEDEHWQFSGSTLGAAQGAQHRAELRRSICIIKKLEPFTAVFDDLLQ